jgi:hypothetical protein
VAPKVLDASAASYRFHWDRRTWFEGAYQQYTDGTRGPGVTFTRWFGDTTVQVTLRKGGNASFAGLAVSIPLTPRQGMAANTVQVSGMPRFELPFRTRVATGGTGANYISDTAVRPIDLGYKAEDALLDFGRMNPTEIRSQVQRMRESFYLHARDQLQ